LTGGFAGSEAGGYFGAELKRAGWDLIIFEGVSPTPVYLAIKDDQVELRSAEHVWGLETAAAERVIRQEMGERRARVSQCGPAGENLVLISNVMHDATRAAGRTGVGAVMGSKKLRGVAVRGSNRPPVADTAKLDEMARWFRDNYRDTSAAAMAQMGTMRMVRVTQTVGGLPTRNFREGQFEGFEKLSFEAMSDTMLIGRDTCFGCPVRCKFVVEVDDDKYKVDRVYGGPEYETTGSLGSACGIDDLKAVAYGNQLCNANGLDTIGTGMTIAFAMECFERGLIGPKDTNGLDLRFGNAEAMVETIRRISPPPGYRRPARSGQLPRRAGHRRRCAGLRHTDQGPGSGHARSAHQVRPWVGHRHLSHRRRPYEQHARYGLCVHRGRQRLAATGHPGAAARG
jgi:aldehyde:ferredoxin oxidoreductase